MYQLWPPSGIKVNKSRYIALSVVSGSIKKLFFQLIVPMFIFSKYFFSLDFAPWKSVGLPTLLHRDSLTLNNQICREEIVFRNVHWPCILYCKTFIYCPFTVLCGSFMNLLWYESKYTKRALTFISPPPAVVSFWWVFHLPPY